MRYKREQSCLRYAQLYKRCVFLVMLLIEAPPPSSMAPLLHNRHATSACQGRSSKHVQLFYLFGYTTINGTINTNTRPVSSFNCETANHLSTFPIRLTNQSWVLAYLFPIHQYRSNPTVYVITAQPQFIMF